MIINTTLQYNSEAAAGTGIVINANGLVLTNNHVIDDATKITATVGLDWPDLPGDGRRLRQDRGRRPDPAAERVRADDGTDRQLLLGQGREPVVALGNAEGRGTITATAGRVTGLNQTITASDKGGSTASRRCTE